MRKFSQPRICCHDAVADVTACRSSDFYTGVNHGQNNISISDGALEAISGGNLSSFDEYVKQERQKNKKEVSDARIDDDEFAADCTRSFKDYLKGRYPDFISLPDAQDRCGCQGLGGFVSCHFRQDAKPGEEHSSLTKEIATPSETGYSESQAVSDVNKDAERHGRPDGFRKAAGKPLSGYGSQPLTNPPRPILSTVPAVPAQPLPMTPDSAP
ncbi:hypothetical protein [Noviherbaspirillum soli]|uniref:hypothetical protein n=1 Tax=Noviherbaspirillum soli TaxID=1064518 RepID=UPI00188CB982|nr:hypothetical protein [Noviherbaspirillum soli]